MQTELTKLIEAMQKHAQTCETVPQDKTQEVLTGASCDQDRNTLEAKEWMLRSQVWHEAEAVVRGSVLPAQQHAPCI